ncbi:MAG: DUF2236 domain-containing protein [Myxococcales bacterium]|nr:DUF2236 domain-containing protein [Myxococcales bacterium]
MSPPAQPRQFACYWRNLDQPWVRALRGVCRRVLGFDPAPSPERARDIAAMYYDADPLAEAFVEEVYLRRGMAQGRALLERALAEGTAAMPDAPASLVRLFADIEHDPSWVDHEQVALGARTFRRYGPAMFRFAGTITLQAYSESSVAKPLALTGAYGGDSARHRFLETVAFWIAVSEPGGLAPGGAGRTAALRVRIMHVFVRQRLLQHPEWDAEDYGVPISQADAMLTLMGGSAVPGVAMRVLGYWPSEHEIEAMMHLWRYVGHLMGVRPRWYPGSLREAAELLFVAMVKASHQAGEDGRMLCQSYARAFSPSGTGPWPRRLREAIEHGVHLGYTRLFLPPRSHRYNELPKAGPWVLAPLLPLPAVLAAEGLRRISPAFEAALDRHARRRSRRWLERQLGEREAEYQPVQSFTR